MLQNSAQNFASKNAPELLLLSPVCERHAGVQTLIGVVASMCAHTRRIVARCCLFLNGSALTHIDAVAAAADDGAAMLALADRSENGRQRSAAEAERFTDAYSQLDAFRHPIDERNGEEMLRQWSAVICDRYTFLMRPTE